MGYSPKGSHVTGLVRHRAARWIPHLALRLIPLVLLLAIAVHPVGMATFALAHGAGEVGVTPVIEGQHHGCPGHPAPSRMCGAAKPFVQRLSLSLMILALLIAFTAPPLRLSAATGGTDWQWPPNKRRALLQVFLR